jgi:hypothetical protein
VAAFDRPDADITAPVFFADWLPRAYTASGSIAPDDAPVVRVTLSGAAGGEWTIVAEGDSLTVTPSPAPGGGRSTAPAPDVWLRQTAADFLAAFAADPDLPELLPAGWGPLHLLFLDPRDVTLIRQIDGRLAVEIAGKRRRRWVIDIAVGKAGMAAGRPRATVRLDGTTYDGLRRGTMPPLQALLERKITVEGDRALAMQALLLLGSRLGRG